METVTGIFETTEQAKRAFLDLKENEHFNGGNLLLLTPDSTAEKIDQVPTDEGEQPGMGSTIGGVVGGAAGLATGAALANLILPGVGPVIVIGVSAGAGVGGAALGAAGGSAAERALSTGLPRDEMFFYEDALRCGQSVVIANAESDDSADTARSIMERNQAQSVDAAREKWWIGIRDGEVDHYRGAIAEESPQREKIFRAGFEAALRPDMRNKPWNKAAKRLREEHPEICHDEIFRRGYERGRRHLRTFEKNGGAERR